MSVGAAPMVIRNTRCSVNVGSLKVKTDSPTTCGEIELTGPPSRCHTCLETKLGVQVKGV